ncbi:helix-turn-helix transcriptional regulator [Streptomyces sp. NPDC002248]
MPAPPPPDPDLVRQRQAVGEALRAARRARRMTQEAVALEAGVDRASLVRIERGQQDPHLSTLLRIAAVLDGVRLAVLDDA